MPTLEEKRRALEEALRRMGSVAVAFSAGVDSTCLLQVASRVLGDRAAAITVRSQFVPQREQQEAAEFCRSRGIRLIVLELDALSIPGVRENPADRCYLCKKSIFTQICAAARENGFACVAEGSNADDLGDYRPGMRAIRELGVRSPLLDAGLTKAEIRLLSHDLGLPTWDKPAMACLATRFATGHEITNEGLARVEQAEQCLMELGFSKVRVRVHGELARIEVEPDMISRLTEAKTAALVSGRLRRLGFRYVSVDLTGYQMGSMNTKK